MKKNSMLVVTMKKVAAGLLLAVFCQISSARDELFYVGIGVGGAKVAEPVGGGCAPIMAAGATTCDEDDTTTPYSFLVGMRLGSSFAIEAGARDLRTVSLGWTDANGNNKWSWSAMVGELSLVGRVQTDTLDYFIARVGGFSYSVETKPVGASLAGAAVVEATGASAFAGLGFEHAVRGSSFRTRFEWSRYWSVGDEVKTGTSNIDTLTFSVLYGF